EVKKMKQVKLIYNPMAGSKEFPKKIDKCIEKFQAANYQVNIFRSSQPGDLVEGLKEGITDADAVVVAGGDGSVNEIINGMMKYNIDLPLGVLPAGTANDFACHLNIPNDIGQALDVITEENIRAIDLGQVNDRYFVNVCAAGLLANVSHQIDINLKNTLGKLAYYIKGIEQLPKFEALPLRISEPHNTIQDEFYLFLVLNGKSAGGFNRLAPEAKIDDGLFEFVGVKACPLHEAAGLFVKILQGKHLADKNIVHLKGEQFKIEILDQQFKGYSSDVDGEQGPDFPLEIKLFRKELKVFAN
ncbi:MAG: YegS/Rv2252/BmrU family lipid kinase, partial [Bacillota bacterium]